MTTLNLTITVEADPADARNPDLLRYEEIVQRTYLKSSASGEPRRVPNVLRIVVIKKDAKIQRFTDGRWRTLYRQPPSLIKTTRGFTPSLSDEEFDRLPLWRDHEGEVDGPIGDLMGIFADDRNALLAVADSILAAMHGSPA